MLHAKGMQKDKRNTNLTLKSEMSPLMEIARNKEEHVSRKRTTVPGIRQKLQVVK